MAALEWEPWKKFVLLFLLLHVYLLIGMFAFHFLEMTHEDNTRVDTRKFKEDLLKNYTCLDRENLERLIDMVADAINNGVDPSDNATSPSNWEYPASFFFAGTIITTIGYGHLSPNTAGGRAFSVIYALIGIPIFAFFLTECGRKLYKGKTWLQGKFNQKFPKKWHRLSFGGFITMGIGMLASILIPSIIFAEIEGWPYGDAVYYCFITLTTIGFGDFVAGHDSDKVYPGIYKVLVFYWIMVGLAQVALVIQDISKMMSSTVVSVREHRDNPNKTHESKEKDENTNDVNAANTDYGTTLVAAGPTAGV